MSVGAKSSSKKRSCLKWGGVALGALTLLLIVVPEYTFRHITNQWVYGYTGATRQKGEHHDEPIE